MKYHFILAVSYLSLLWERAWNRLWAAASLLMFFASLSLLNIPAMFGIAWHMAFLCIFLISMIIVLIRTGTAFVFPARADIERHIERISALRHRPIETMHDRPAEGLSVESIGLWRKHLQKAAGYIEHLKIYTPSPDVSSHDKFALRYAAVIFLAVGLVIAQDDGFIRLHQAISPDTVSLITGKNAALDIWITPPEYTHEPAVFLSAAGQGIASHSGGISVPEGSILKLRMSGYRYPPQLQYAAKSYALTEPAPGSFTAELVLQQSGQLKLSSLFSSIGQWPITVAPDTAPEISIVQIDTTPRAATKISYKAHDDHGITAISGIISLAPDMAGKSSGKNEQFDIPVSNSASHVEDLTASLWAGLPVSIVLQAIDGAGHQSASSPAEFVLPERKFSNPAARRIIEERKSLLWAKNPLSIRAVAGNLSEIADQPQLYKGDGIVFLSLVIAVNRLIYDGSEDAVLSVQRLLWDVALKLEDGGLSLAQRELRDALQKMSAALDDKNISQQQLQDILEDVQKKMQQYVKSLAAEMQQRMQQGKNIPVISAELAHKFMKSIDIGKMLEQMRQLSQGNSRENLQKMAENLKNMIDNIDMKKFDQMQEQQMKAMESLQNLEDIIHRQQSLLDQTNKSSDPEETKEHAQEQSALRQKLGEATAKLGNMLENIPDNLANASQSMKLSEESLDKGQSRDSVPHQKSALDELQKGIDNAVREMSQSMQQSILSFGLQPNNGNYGEGYDPLGRGLGDDKVKIPDKNEQRRVQEIIEELRHRSNEPNRSKVEHDYIDRLLDNF